MNKGLEHINWLCYQNAGADKETYLGALKDAHQMISNTAPEEWDPDANKQRWEQHQQVSRDFADAREEAGVAKVVFGFFPYGVCEEHSTFGYGLECAAEYFEVVESDTDIEDLYIGYGPEDFKVTVRAKFDTSMDQDYGWSDGMGTHTEYYVAKTRTYVRTSMTGRAFYKLQIDANGICTPVDRSKEDAS